MMKLLVAIAMLCMSCGTVLQKSVRSDSVYCSDSRLYAAGDLLIAAGYALAASGAARAIIGVGPNQVNEPLAYLPIPIFVGSAAIGIYKRHNCAAWKAEAPPEEWARAAAEQQQRAADREALEQQRQQLLLQQQQQQQPPPPVTTDGSQPAPHTPSAIDELGVACTGRWPDAGTCRYGSVCYAGTCTIWCPSGGGCPASYQCIEVRNAGKVCLQTRPASGLDPFAH